MLEHAASLQHEQACSASLHQSTHPVLVASATSSEDAATPPYLPLFFNFQRPESHRDATMGRNHMGDSLKAEQERDHMPSLESEAG
jgi:hypothetical protein